MWNVLLEKVLGPLIDDGDVLVRDMHDLWVFRAGKVRKRVNGSSNWKNVYSYFFLLPIVLFPLSVLLTPPVLKTSSCDNDLTTEVCLSPHETPP